MRCILVLMGIFVSTSIFSLEQPVLNIQHWETKNGAEVYFVQRKELPMLDIQIVFNAGSAEDPANNLGLSSLTNAMIGENTKHLDADGIARAFENVGAQLGNFSDRDMAGLSLRTLIGPKFLEPALTTFQAVISEANFPSTAFNRLKEQTIAQLKAQQQDPWQLASNQFFQLIYGTAVYAHNPLGTTADVNAMNQHQLMQFYQQFYVAKNADIILVGDITTAQANSISEKLAQSLPTGNAARTLNMAENLSKNKSAQIQYPLKQSTIMLGQVGITRQNPDFFPLIVGNAVLGGLPLSSLLYYEIREKNGLAYVASSGFEPMALRGPFIIAMQTKAASTQTALTMAQTILKKFIETGPTQDELTAAKQNLIARFPLTLSTNSGILAVLTHIAFYHQPLNYLDVYAQNINAVTTEQVKNAFEKNIDPNKMATVIVGPR